MKIVTLQQLIDLGACNAQVELFRTKFGDSVEVTRELCESVASAFDFNWAAEHLLNAQACAEYKRVRASACAEYKRVCDTAWAEYKRVRDTARAEYDRVCDTARAEYERVRDTAWAEYERVHDTAWAEYERVHASAWADAYLSLTTDRCGVAK